MEMIIAFCIMSRPLKHSRMSQSGRSHDEGRGGKPTRYKQLHAVRDFSNLFSPSFTARRLARSSGCWVSSLLSLRNTTREVFVMCLTRHSTPVIRFAKTGNGIQAHRTLKIVSSDSVRCLSLATTPDQIGTAAFPFGSSDQPTTMN
jgi:hypothetical protein